MSAVISQPNLTPGDLAEITGISMMNASQILYHSDKLVSWNCLHCKSLSVFPSILLCYPNCCWGWDTNTLISDFLKFLPTIYIVLTLWADHAFVCLALQSPVPHAGLPSVRLVLADEFYYSSRAVRAGRCICVLLLGLGQEACKCDAETYRITSFFYYSKLIVMEFWQHVCWLCKLWAILKGTEPHKRLQVLFWCTKSLCLSNSFSLKWWVT